MAVDSTVQHMNVIITIVSKELVSICRVYRPGGLLNLGILHVD